MNAALWGVSPGFESNDLGFHSNGDRAGAHAVVIWRNVTPGRFFASRSIWVAKAWTWNFAREMQSDGFNVAGNDDIPELLVCGAPSSRRRRSLEDRLTRGGPSSSSPRGGFGQR